MSNIIVFGASGRTGHHLLTQALAQGHQVTAFTRRAHEQLRGLRTVHVTLGDVRDADAVSAAMTDQHLVLSALGPSQKNEPICADGTRNIMLGMHAHGIRRLVALSAYGAADSHHGLYSWMVWHLITTKMQDKAAMEDLVRASGLDWTLVRPPALYDGPQTGTYRAGTSVPVKLNSRISRADLAEFMLREAQTNQHLHAAPAIVARK